MKRHGYGFGHYTKEKVTGAKTESLKNDEHFRHTIK